MIALQNHIINEVFLDVHTNSKAVAYELRDNLDMFLKNDILPYIEAYFESIDSTLPSEIVHIPKLDINISLEDANHLEQLKELIKSEVVSKVNLAIEPSHLTSQMGVEFINSNESDLKTFFFFIEKGVSPWWKATDAQLNFSSEVIAELATKSSFSSQFTKLLEKIEVQERVIKQFSDQDLLVLFDKSYQYLNVKELITDQVILRLSQVNPIERLFVWQQLIDYFQSSNPERLIKRFNKVYHRITSKQALNQATHLNQVVLSLMKVLISKQSTSLKVAWNSKNEITFKKQSMAKELYVLLKILEISSEEIEVINQSEKLAEIKIERLFESKSSVGEIGKKASFTSEYKETTTNAKNAFSDKHEKSEEKAFEDSTDSKSGTLNEVTKESIGIDQGKELVKEENKIQELDGIEEKHIEKGELITTDSKSQELANNKDEELVAKERVSASDDLISSEEIKNEISDEERLTSSQELQEKETEKTTSEEEKIDNTLDKTEAKINAKNESDSYSEENSVKALKEETGTPPYSDTQELNKAASSAHQNELDEQMDEAKVIQKKFSEFEQIIKSSTKKAPAVVDDTGDYYVQNAGLIILHPFLKHFFTNCNLLDTKNNFTDIDTAIHVLHYAATRQEKQLESNLMFEKFLCGLPITESIRRDIKLTDSLKEEADALLASVIQNWEVLKNASGDLLRNEFLKREGKLSFKEEHPKITIARKTQDILLDKLPWGLGLCKLPWRDTLIFTDW